MSGIVAGEGEKRSEGRLYGFESGHGYRGIHRLCAGGVAGRGAAAADLETLITETLGHPEVRRARELIGAAEARVRAMKRSTCRPYPRWRAAVTIRP